MEQMNIPDTMYDTIVIGAGVSGLTAAYELTKSGNNVVVLEAANRTGGRIFTDHEGAFTYDVGTQLITEYFDETLQLIRDLGIKDHLERFKDVMWMRNNHKFKMHNIDSLWSRMNPPWLTVKDRLLLLRLLADVIKYRKMLSIQEIERSIAIDCCSVEEYALRKLNSRILQNFISPFLSTVFFAYPSETSFPLLAVLSKKLKDSKLYTLRSGIQLLTDELASRVNVKFQKKAVNVVRVEHGWEVHTDDGRGIRKVWKSKQVVIATLAHQALELLANRSVITDKQRQFLQKQKYFSTFAFITGYSRRIDAQAYCMIIPVSESPRISSICFEHEKCAQHAPEGFGLHNIHLHRGFAQEIMRYSEAEQKDAILTELEKIFPTYRRYVVWSKLYNWIDAVPCTYPGKAKEILEFQIEQWKNINSGLVFCGDYLNWPTVEGAIVVGKKAANMLLGRTKIMY